MPVEGNTPGYNDASTVAKDATPANQGIVYLSAESTGEDRFPQRKEDQCEINQKRQQATEKWKFIFEVVTALFLGATVIINWYMWSEMRKSTEATKVAADAEVAAVAAWIVVDSWAYEGIEKNQARFKLVLKNVGKIPATGAKAAWEFSFLPTKDLNLIPRRDAYQCPKSGVSPAIIPPDKTWANDIGSPSLTAEQAKIVTDRAGMIFIHGCVTYRDVLSPEKERITEFSVIYPSLKTDGVDNLTIYEPYTRMK